MSEPSFEGIYRLAFDEHRYRASVLATLVEAYKEASKEVMNETPSIHWESLERLLDLQIDDAETFILGVDMKTLISLVETTQTDFDEQEAEAAEEAARRDRVKL